MMMHCQLQNYLVLIVLTFYILSINLCVIATQTLSSNFNKGEFYGGRQCFVLEITYNLIDNIETNNFGISNIQCAKFKTTTYRSNVQTIFKK